MEPSPRGYEFFEHTADVGLRAYGETLTELFIHVAHGLVVLLVEDSLITSKETRAIALSAPSVEGLLLAWLKELLFWFGTDRFLPRDYQLHILGETSLRGHVGGERFDPTRHTHGVEIKGVTYHQFRVERTTNGWEASVILDV